MTGSTTRAWSIFFIGAAIGLIVATFGDVPDRIQICSAFGLAVGGVILLISTVTGRGEGQ